LEVHILPLPAMEVFNSLASFASQSFTPSAARLLLGLAFAAFGVNLIVIAFSKLKSIATKRSWAQVAEARRATRDEKRAAFVLHTDGILTDAIRERVTNLTATQLLAAMHNAGDSLTSVAVVTACCERAM
jgi:hypothetical protein